MKLVPDEPSADVVSRRLPLLFTMLMATACQAESLIGPVTPLIVAEALVNVTVPKFARAAGYCRRPTGRGLDDPLGGAPRGGRTLRRAEL